MIEPELLQHIRQRKLDSVEAKQQAMPTLLILFREGEYVGVASGQHHSGSLDLAFNALAVAWYAWNPTRVVAVVNYVVSKGGNRLISPPEYQDNAHLAVPAVVVIDIQRNQPLRLDILPYGREEDILIWGAAYSRHTFTGPTWDKLRESVQEIIDLTPFVLTPEAKQFIVPEDQPSTDIQSCVQGAIRLEKMGFNVASTWLDEQVAPYGDARGCEGS